MKITYLGTAAAEGFPAMFCDCEFCRKAISLGKSEFRTRSQVLIDDDLLVDFPPEAYVHYLGGKFSLSSIKYLLVSHSHMDHFYAHDFILRGYKYAKLKEDVLNIFGNSEVKKVFDECTAREMKEVVAPHVKVNVIDKYYEFTIGDYRILTLPAQHSNEETALLFYIEKAGKGYLHLYDTGRICDDALEFLREKGAKASLVSFDCTFVRHTAGAVSRHMGIEDDVDLKSKLFELGVVDDKTKYVITHFSHNAYPLRSNLKEIEEKYGVIAAYDGMQIEI